METAGTSSLFLPRGYVIRIGIFGSSLVLDEMPDVRSRANFDNAPRFSAPIISTKRNPTLPGTNKVWESMTERTQIDFLKRV